MLDIKYIEKNYKLVKKNLKQRGFILKPQILRNYWEIKELNIKIEAIYTILNNGNGNKELKDELAKLKIQKQQIEDIWNPEIQMIPNLLHPTTPFGQGAEDNVEIKKVGEQNKTQENYLDIANKNGLHIEIGVKLAQARFNIMNGKVAKLHRKLINLAIDTYEKMGYEYHYLPNLVNQNTMYGTGQYPKFQDDLFKTEDGLYLIPTGEVPLTNIYQNNIIPEQNAENKLMTHTPCFRKEAGAYGKDTKGIIRQHQFEKVELVRTCLPENGLQTFYDMVQNVEDFVKTLNITYRIIELCTKDIGFAGHKAYDFEVWFPNEETWKEIATITWCGDFQARRMNAKVKRKNGKKEFLHTLNGTGVAVGRVMACMIETHGENIFID